MLLLEKIYDLTPEQSQILHSELIGSQLVEIREFDSYRWLQLGGSSIQGLMNVNSPNQILLPNIQALLGTLLFCPKPNRLLNLGFGCGSIERFFNAKLPDLEITSIELNEKVIRLAKEFFFVPNESRIVNDSAAEFLEKEKSLCDIILCDIFVDEEHSVCLYESDFYAHAIKCLGKTGVLAINLLPESEEDVINVLLPIKDHFDYIYLLEFPDYMNAIIFASCRKLPNMVELEIRANDLFEKTDLDLRELPERLNIILETI
jgi:spermidine synthase